MEEKFNKEAPKSDLIVEELKKFRQEQLEKR